MFTSSKNTLMSRIDYNPDAMIQLQLPITAILNTNNSESKNIKLRI